MKIGEIKSLQQAYSLQEMLNSEMAVAQSRLKEAADRIEKRFCEECGETVGNYEEKDFLLWLMVHPECDNEANGLWMEKTRLEELYVQLDSLIERMESDTSFSN